MKTKVIALFTAVAAFALTASAQHNYDENDCIPAKGLAVMDESAHFG